MKLENKKIYYLVDLIFFVAGFFLFYQGYTLYTEKKNFDAINETSKDSNDVYFAYYIDGVISRICPFKTQATL